MTEPTILRATTSADFLAALPRLTGMRAPESLVVVLFARNRTLGAARLDLPPLAHLESPGAEIAAWLRAVAEIALRGEAAAVVVQTGAELTERPMTSPHGRLTAVLADVLHEAGVSLRDALAVGSDGWAGFVGTDFPELRPLTEIKGSPLHDPSFAPLGVDEWREQHPGRTAEGPEQISELADRIAAGGHGQRREV